MDMKALRSRRDAQARTLREKAADALGVAQPDSYPLAKVPASTVPVSRLPRRRRRAFRTRLRGVIRDAFARDLADLPAAQGESSAPDLPESRANELAAVLGRACALCRGFCCILGRDHAFITVGTIERYRRAHPEQGPREVLAAYSAFVGTETLRSGCVFQLAGGCALPRDMRSDTCNQFLCSGLREIVEGMSDGAPVRAFAYATSEGELSNGAFLDARETRVVPVTLTRRRSGAEADNSL